MYETPHRSLFQVQEDDLTLIHQLTISKLTVELGVLCYHEKHISLVPLPSTFLADGPDYPIVDIMLYDEEAEQTRVVIEISSNRGLRNDVRKLIRLIKEDDYSILEGIVYNYKTREWLRYRKGDGGAVTALSYSEVMQVEMGGFV